MRNLARKIHNSIKSNNKISPHRHHNNMHHKQNHLYQFGVLDDYNYRPNKYKQIQGDVCINNLIYDGITFGEFICPVEGFDYASTSCCGPLYEQYCCTPAEASAYKVGFYNPYASKLVAKNEQSKATLTYLFLILSFLLTLIFI